MARFHAGLDQIRAGLLADGRGASRAGASRLGEGNGEDALRSYEYGLLLHAQQTADRVTTLARYEAERILTDADREVAVLEQRVAELRRIEAELSGRVSDELRSRVA